MKRGSEEEILRTYLPLIEWYFRSRVTQFEDVEDLSQETAYQVIRSWNRFQHRAAVSTWIYSICRNIFTTYLRRQKRVLKGNPDPYLYETKQSVEEERQIIDIVIESLGPDDKILYDLYYCKGHSVKEISQNIAKPEGTVKYGLYMLRRNAKKLLE